MTESNTRPFKVPFGLAPEGRLWEPGLEIPDGPWSCPACKAPLIVRGGGGRIRLHFAHKADSGCSPESALHACAKLRLAEVVTAWLGGAGDPPGVRMECPGAELIPGCEGAEIHLLQEAKVDGVALEFPIGDRRVDVALLCKGKPHLAIEVLVSHEVDEQKAGELAVGWIELEATQVMKDPLTWAPVQSGGFKKRRCVSCARFRPEEFERHLREARRHQDSFVEIYELNTPEDVRWAINKVAGAGSIKISGFE